MMFGPRQRWARRPRWLTISWSSQHAPRTPSHANSPTAPAANSTSLTLFMATPRLLVNCAPWASPPPVAFRGCPSGRERRATERSLILVSPTWLAVKEACPHSVRRQSQNRQPPPSSRSLTPPSPCACASRSTDSAEATTASRSPSTRNS